MDRATLLPYRELHLELTSKCALKCPECPRTIFAGQYKVTEMPMAMIERLTRTRAVYDGINLCGDHGDPIYHSQFHEVLRTLRQMRGEPSFYIATNGSHRDQAWWEETAKYLHHRDRVVFGVDGLADTSHLYRRGNDWESIDVAIRTLKAKSRVQVDWQWILFGYNQDQLAAAKRQAREWKIDSFRLLESPRTGTDPVFVPTISIEEARLRFEQA